MKEIKVTRKLKEALRQHFTTRHGTAVNLPPELARLPSSLIAQEALRAVQRREQRQGVYD